MPPPEQDDEGSLEDLILGLGESVLATGTSSSEEYALAIGKDDGVYLLLPNEKKLIQIVKNARLGNNRVLAVNKTTLYHAHHSTVIYLGGGSEENCFIYDVMLCPLLLTDISPHKKAQEANQVLREGEVAGLRSIRGRLHDFGAFASGTKTYAIFDTLACPTGSELPIAIRDHPIRALFEHQGIVYDLSHSKLFETSSSPTGKEEAIEIEGFCAGDARTFMSTLYDACSYQGRIYLAGISYNHSSFPVVGELEGLLRGEPTKIIEKEVSLPTPLRRQRIEFLKFFQHGKLFVGVSLNYSLGDSKHHIHIYDPFSDYETKVSADISYETSPLAAKFLGAVPISKEVFDRFLGDERVFNEAAKPSMLAEIRDKVERVYQAGEDRINQLPSMLQDPTEAGKLFAELRKLRSSVVAEYAKFGINEKEVQPSPMENKFKLYEQMVAGAR